MQENNINPKSNVNSLLKPSKNETAFLKVGIMGFQGSGKTFTSSRLAAGVVKYAKIENPKVAMFDTEKSSDFLTEYFAQQKIEFSVVKSRAFKDLCASIIEAQNAGYNAFIVDSVTHVWNELLSAHDLRFGRKDFLSKLQPVKTEWAKFTELFINSPMHFFSLGRAGYQWENEIDEETGKRKTVQTGTKFKAEGEFGYESDLLLEMERVEDQRTGKDVNRCWVRKDRWDLLDGKSFDYPTFETFLPIVKKLAIGVSHVGFDNTRNSADMFDSPESNYQNKKQKEIALEELDATLTKLDLSGTAKETQKKRIEILEQVFGTSSKRAIEDLHTQAILNGIAAIKQIFVPKEETAKAVEHIKRF